MPTLNSLKQVSVQQCTGIAFNLIFANRNVLLKLFRIQIQLVHFSDIKVSKFPDCQFRLQIVDDIGGPYSVT